MASRFLVAGGDGTWNNTNNWSASSGGGSGASFPVAGDTVAFDSLSGNANMTVSVASACASLVMSGTYAGTLTFNSTLTLTSTVTFISTCTIAGTAGTLIMSGASTMTSGGKTLTCALTLNVSTSYTLADSWTVNGLLTTTNSITINGVGKVMHAVGGYHQSSGSNYAGTAKLSLEGGTWDNAGINVLATDVDLAGNVTISGTVGWGANGKSLRYVSGTITTTGSTLQVATSGSIVDCAGVTWNNFGNGSGISFVNNSLLVWSGTLTFTGNCTITGTGALNGSGPVSIANAQTLTLSSGALVTTGTMTLPDAPVTFAGANGWTVGGLTSLVLGTSRILTLTQGNAYRVTSTLSSGATAVFRQAIKSSVPGTQVVFTVDGGCVQSLAYVDPTDIDGSTGGGAIVYSVGATVNNSPNWVGSLVAAKQFNFLRGVGRM